MALDFNSLRRVMLDATRACVVPGGIVAVGDKGKPVFLEAFGYRQLVPEREPAMPDGVYDLASLTKALVTAPLAMVAVDRGLVGLDSEAGTVFSSLSDQPGVTLRRLLSHSAGFPAHRRFFEAWPSTDPPTEAMRETMVSMAASHPLAYAPGTQSIYSDLGFILLGAWLEKIFGDRLDRLADRIWFSPLGLKSLRFPGGSPFPPDAVIAPTEDCPSRKVMVSGEVHDLNARAMGGIAGHAGLFGSAADVLGMALELSKAFHGRGAGIVQSSTVRTFFSPQGIPGSTWRLGFDGPSAQGSLAGDRITRSAVGHLAFTGCSFWMDPATGTCVVFLCNRVHPVVHDDPRFRVLRRDVNDAALAAIGYGAS